MSRFRDFELAAQQLISQIGKSIVIGVPIGIGKPVGLLNALYQLASRDSSIHLTIITGLTLARPLLHHELEKRLVNPILDRLLKNYEEPLYEKFRISQQLPKNIRVIEFFLTPGKYLHNASVQQNYISSSYSNAGRDVINLSINVLAQQVAPSSHNPNVFSLSSNTDLFHEIKNFFHSESNHGNKFAIVAEINANLPFMPGNVAEVNSDIFSHIIDTQRYPALFSLPREAISAQDHMIGIYGSTLIKDNGCLQIGIGGLGNALANALIFRHQKNALYQKLVERLHVEEKFGDLISSIGETNIFQKGLYASTEMLSDEYLQLFSAGILKKRVYDHIKLQELLNENKINETVSVEMIDILLDEKIIHTNLTDEDVSFLQQFGIFKREIQFHDNHLILENGISIFADLQKPELKKQILNTCLGKKLESGKIIHAGFFVGSTDFYTKLSELSHNDLDQIEMTTISRTNTLLWSPELLKLQRQSARFVNSSLMVTMLGGIISDGLDDYQEVSGVGGQYDFVNMANQLSDSHSIITCRSTRKTKNGIKSNIVWKYSNSTISRYLCDIVITEYGIADCRSKTDEEIIKTILNVTDSRFQEELLKQAKKAGKLSSKYQIPELFKNNHANEIEKRIHELQKNNYFMPYPFGSDLTKEEEVLARVLNQLKYFSQFKLFILFIRSFLFFKNDASFESYLIRMKLNNPRSFSEFCYKKLIKFVIYLEHAKNLLYSDE